MGKITPMMQQYFDIKENYKDCILFYRLGDFYEMFFDDAILASKELEITLTGREWGQDERAPMCGVPFHSSDGYIAKLIKKGYKVAICEQTEDASLAKGLVNRDVVRVITPGTNIDINSLDDKNNNYIASICLDEHSCGIVFCDVSTGEVNLTELTGNNIESKIINEIDRFNVSEIIANRYAIKNKSLIKDIKLRFNLDVSFIYDNLFDESEEIIIESQFKNSNDINQLNGLQTANNSLSKLMIYLNDTQKTNLTHIDNLKIYKKDEYLND